MPPKKPPASTILQKRCKQYLEETNHSDWKFTDFWNGGGGVILARYGDAWVRVLQKISATVDDDRHLAATAALESFRNNEHLSESSRVRQRKVVSKRLKKQGPPPAYESSQEETPSPKPGKSNEQHPSDEFLKDQTAVKPCDFNEPQEPQEESPVADHSSPEQLCEPPQGAIPAASCISEQNPPSKPRNPHEQQHQALSKDRKWYLPSGRSVEDILFLGAVSQSNEARRLKQVPKESYAHSYILDMDDSAIEALFTIEEWKAIVSRLLPPPKLHDSLVSYLYEFSQAKTAADLRHRLMTTPYVPVGETYCRDKHGDKAWVHSALSSLVILYEVGHMPPNDNLEAWFQINIWGPIFDRCFQYIPKMSIARSESQSPSNSDRKNLPAARKPIGRKYDGLITHNDIEYGAVEDSKQLKVDEKSKKWTSDSLKLAKVLHDQMRGLETEVNHDRDALGKFRCVGFLTAGLHCQGLYLQYASGYVSLLKRSGKCKVPKSVAPLPRLIAVLVMVWQVRETVRRSIVNLEEYLGNTEVLFRAAVEQTVALPDILKVCLDTDAEF